jgi:hypothetical protein
MPQPSLGLSLAIGRSGVRNEYEISPSTTQVEPQFVAFRYPLLAANIRVTTTRAEFARRAGRSALRSRSRSRRFIGLTLKRGEGETGRVEKAFDYSADAGYSEAR